MGVRPEFFSGGGRTDSVEAFAGAQGQRGRRGFEAPGGKRDPELVERGAASLGPKGNRTHNGPVMRRWPVPDPLSSDHLALWADVARSGCAPKKLSPATVVFRNHS